MATCLVVRRTNLCTTGTGSRGAYVAALVGVTPHSTVHLGSLLGHAAAPAAQRLLAAAAGGFDPLQFVTEIVVIVLVVLLLVFAWKCAAYPRRSADGASRARRQVPRRLAVVASAGLCRRRT